ncbi:MAG: OmpA family protein [Deltaproteobacteria bacterium]|nr:OmpA family protein [Deltaproteobacteria bacterium]
MRKVVICILTVCAFLTVSAFVQAETADEWFEMGNYYYDQQIFSEAIQAYTKAIDMEPNFVEAFFLRGKSNALLKPSNVENAIRDFTSVIEMDSQNADAYYERGLLNAFVINNEQALADMKTAAALGHKGAYAWLYPDQPEESGLEYIDLSRFMSNGQAPVVLFDFDLSLLKDDARMLLNELGTVLKTELPSVYVVLMGHTDSTGAERYNDNLSMKRAEAVKSYLASTIGIDPNRLIMKGFGESHPAAPNDTEEGRSLNRRVEIVGVERR